MDIIDTPPIKSRLVLLISENTPLGLMKQPKNHAIHPVLLVSQPQHG